jgi:transposase
MEVFYEVSAGADVHRDTVVVAIRKRAVGRDEVETRTFTTFHDSLIEMVAWLDEHDVPIIGLESTGVYWKPIVRALQMGPKKRIIWLVNPAEVKKVPGRKTDVNDAQWLSKLVMHGLVSPSFLPGQDLEELRKLTRFRTKLVGEQTSVKNRLLKELESSGIKLASVCSDVFGKSGLAMLKMLLEGGHAPAEIAQLAQGALRAKMPMLERAVAGSFSDATRYVLQRLLASLQRLAGELVDLDKQIQTRLDRYAPDVALLQTVPGLDRVTIAAVLAEIGGDMSVFAGADNLAAWSGLCPGSNESAGKHKAAPTRKGDKYLRTSLVQAAWSAVRTRGVFWNRKFKQLVVRLGPKKTIVAIARRMVVAIFYILRDSTPYNEPAQTPGTPERNERKARNLRKQLEALGFDVSVTPKAPLAPSEALPGTPAPPGPTFS